jgi:hypothetical protein
LRRTDNETNAQDSSNDLAMRRRLPDFLSVLSLLTCMALVALWVRSYWVGDQLKVLSPHDSRDQFRLLAGHGRMSLGLILFDSVDNHRAVEYTESYPFALTELQPQTVSARLGFGYWAWRSERLQGSYNQWVVVPMWILAVPSAVLPALAAGRFVRRRSRSTTGRCDRCGYDLRATPGRCPECGKIAGAEFAR